MVTEPQPARSADHPRRWGSCRRWAMTVVALLGGLVIGWVAIHLFVWVVIRD